MIQEGLSTSTVYRGLKCSKRYRVIFVAMNVQKEYRRGGFFGSSQDRFSDMEGAGKGVNMAFGSRGILGGNLGGKGRALRREKRYLKKLDRQGKLNEYGPQSGDRLDYLRNVQKDRFKKLAGGAALAAGAAFGAPALAGAVKSQSGLGAILQGAGKAGGKSGFKGLMDLFGKARKAKGNLESIRGLAEGMSPEQQNQIDTGDFYDDPSMNPYKAMGGKIMKQGGLVGGQKSLDKNNDGRLSREDFELLRAMFGAKLPR